MSKLIVEVCRLAEVKPHPNADKLDVAVVKGWQCVIPKGLYKSGDLVTYIPPDAIMPEALSDSLGVTKYLSNGRVRCAKLRGEPSFGVVCQPFGDEGQDVADSLGITKYEPPVKISAGEVEAPHPLFMGYTEIENLRNYQDVFADGEEVVYTEKIHGANCRVGWVRDEAGTPVRMAGSKGLQRKESAGSTYWYPWSLEAVANMLSDLEGRGIRQAMLFGEVYGKVQSLRYGVPKGIAFRAFDLMLDGKYVDAHDFSVICAAFGVPTVPILETGPFSMAKVQEHSRGRSVVPGADNIREGVVVKPIRERHSPTTGRVVMKYISDDYLCGNVEDVGEAVA